VLDKFGGDSMAELLDNALTTWPGSPGAVARTGALAPRRRAPAESE